VVLNWRACLPRGEEAIKLQGGHELPFVLYNMESLINKFNSNYICFYNVFEIMGLETKDNYLREEW